VQARDEAALRRMDRRWKKKKARNGEWWVNLRSGGRDHAHEGWPDSAGVFRMNGVNPDSIGGRMLIARLVVYMHV
jgi:hypothetical protein